MANTDKQKKDLNKFLYPVHNYHGEFTPNNLAFNANIQEFAQKISYICGLETRGKIPPEEAYKKIKSLWKALRQSKHNLIDNTDFSSDGE